MKRSSMALLLALLGLTTLLASPAAAGQPSSPDPFEQNRKLGRGVNIIGYDPIWRSKEHARFQPKHFRLLKEAGFNSVRINLHPFRSMDPEKELAIKPEWFAVADWAVSNAQQQGLMAILDLHEYNAMGEAPDENKQKFLSAWRQLAAHFQHAPSTVLFEVLNEPNKKLTPELWNDFLGQALAIIRETNPTRTVIAGPAFWNSIDHLKDLRIPDSETNLIVTVHYYKPMDFTHQGAAWANRKDKLGVTWEGTPEQLEVIARDFDRANAWAREHHRPIFLGEFGAYDKAPMESRARYVSAVARAAEHRNWSWAYWQFDSDFILYDIPHDTWVEPILKALAPVSGTK